MSEDLGAIFREHIKGTNMMTPKVLEYVRAGHYICEISEGTSMDHEPLYGLTVLCDRWKHNVQRRDELSRCFKSMYKLRERVDILEEACRE